MTDCLIGGKAIMPIHYVAGDIMLNEYNANAYAIPTNCEGVMNLQSTVPFRERYPDLYLDFQRRCEDEDEGYNIGDVYLYHTRDNTAIFNVALYRNRYLVMAGHRTIEEAFRQLRSQAEELGISSIAMPPLGSGTGYLEWTRARRSLERVFRDWEGELYVYIKPPIREEMRHWDEAEIDEDAPVTIPRGWKPQMTLYVPQESKSNNKRSGSGNSRSSSGGRRGGRNRRSDDKKDEKTDDNKSKSSRGRRRRGRRGGRNRRKTTDNNKKE
jgi:hypothetical protein